LPAWLLVYFLILLSERRAGWCWQEWRVSGKDDVIGRYADWSTADWTSRPEPQDWCSVIQTLVWFVLWIFLLARRRIVCIIFYVVPPQPEECTVRCPLVTSPATACRHFVFCNLLYSAPVIFIHDSVTLISTLIIDNFHKLFVDEVKVSKPLFIMHLKSQLS